MASVNFSSNVTRSWLLGYKFLVLSCSEFMVSYILFNVGCLVNVSLKLRFGDKVPTTHNTREKTKKTGYAIET